MTVSLGIRAQKRACTSAPGARVASAVRLFCRKPIGLKWSHHKELADLEDSLAMLPAEDRRKVVLVFV